MAEELKKRLQMSRFEGPQHEGVLALLVVASTLRAEMDRRFGAHGVSNEQYNILRILKGAPEGHSCGAVADRMIDRSPDITRRIDGLEKAGLVERMRSDTDRRVVITKITSAGITLLTTIEPDIVEYNSQIGGNLTDEEWSELASLCDKLIGGFS